MKTRNKKRVPNEYKDEEIDVPTPKIYDTKLTVPMVRCRQGFSLSIPDNINAMKERPRIPPPMPMAR